MATARKRSTKATAKTPQKKGPRTAPTTKAGAAPTQKATAAKHKPTAKARAPSSRKRIYCTFCRKDNTEVAKLVAGPGVFICDGCVELCNRVLAEQPIDSFPGWESLDDDALLRTLHASNAVVEDVRGVLQQHVDLLRARNVSWERIGAALGMSRQAAWERFS